MVKAFKISVLFLIFAIGISAILEPIAKMVEHPALRRQTCGIPVYKDYIGTVEHFVFHGGRGKHVDGYDIVFHRSLPNSTFGSFRFGDDGYTVKVFYPDTVCLEAP